MRANSLSAAGSFLLAALVSGCGSSGDSSPVLQAAPAATESVVAPVLSRSDSRPTAGATGDENVLPVVLVHGMSGDPLAWGPILDPLERGRTVFRECYADDLAELAPGSVSRSSVFAIGYYKRRQSDDLYHGGRCSIGGCPVPRTDGKAGYYSVAYADVVDDAIEAILRATGAPRVDLCGISLGGVISRAYVKWRSARGPGGESRVRRLILLESPTRGVNDLEALMLSLDTMPFQRWGEVAELARDYPGWDGKSYISRLNDGFDAWCAAHGVSYGGLYGTGHCVFNLGNLDRAIHAAQQVLDGGGSDLGNAPPATPESPPSLAAMPEVSSSDAPAPSPPSRGVGPDSVLDAIQDGLIFIDPSRLDIEKCVVEALGDGDGFVRASSASLRAGPEFPGAAFDIPFRGTHLDRGQNEDAIQYAIGTRELIRRFQIEGRTPRARLLRADVRAESGGDAGWLLVDYEQEGDGLSLQLFTETPADYALRTSIPFMPDRSIVHGAPAFDGAHAIRFDGEPAGPRVATLFFYDLGGVVAKLGPFSLDVSPGKKTEGAPTTVFQGETPFPEPGLLSVATNGLGGELSWRIVSPGSAPAWSEWSNAQTFPLPRLPRGTYELFVRSRHSDNAAAVRVEEADPLELGLRVDGSGRIEVRR